jgi:hypothetical protein
MWRDLATKFPKDATAIDATFISKDIIYVLNTEEYFKRVLAESSVCDGCEALPCPRVVGGRPCIVSDSEESLETYYILKKIDPIEALIEEVERFEKQTLYNDWSTRVR